MYTVLSSAKPAQHLLIYKEHCFVVFSSSVFLFMFLPLALLLHMALPSIAAKNVVLLACSLLFYAWGEPVYVWLMVASITANWAFGVALGRSEAPKTRKALLVGAVVFNCLVLGFFKYEGFVADNIDRLLGAQIIPNLELPLPIGISFFTLQALSYVIDVYRRECSPQPNVLYLGMYIAMFPQLVAGPIVRYKTIEEQVRSRTVTLEGFAQGARLFTIGLGKKVLLANTVAILADAMIGQDPASIGMLGCAFGVIAYTFQIYFDFSGYSDMAIGLGRMFGFRYVRNFNYPYISTSITEFWRRWHMSLGSFFRDYVYIPLGGNRVSRTRWMINILAVWGLTGVWHGAAWNFILWGLYYGLLLMAEKLFLLRVLERLPRVVQRLYTLVAVMFGWLLFSAHGLSDVIHRSLGLVGAYGLSGTSSVWELMGWAYLALVPVLVVACTPVLPWLRLRLERWARNDTSPMPAAAPVKGNDDVPPCEAQLAADADPQRARIVGIVNAAKDLALLAVLALSCAAIVSGGYNPFIYFQF